MLIFFISFCVIFMAMLAMGIGLLFRKNGIKGTCGGLSNIADEERSCEVCPCKCHQ